MACYSGKNPLDSEEERIAMWRWARKNSIAPDGREVPGGVDAGESLQKVKDNINQKFYFGQAKDSWLNDIITGRKTPLRAVTNEMCIFVGIYYPSPDSSTLFNCN